MNTNTNQWNEEESGDFDLRGFLLKYVKYWYWFILTVGIALTSAYFHLKQLTPMYLVSTTLLIKDDWTPKNEIEMLLDGSSNKRLDNEMEILKSRPIFSRVADNLSLSVSYWQEGRYRDTELYKSSPVKVDLSEIKSGEPFFITTINASKYKLEDAKRNLIGSYNFSQKITSPFGIFRVFNADPTGKFLNKPIKITLTSKEAIIGQLIGSVRVALRNENSSLVAISLEHALPEKGKDILAKLIDEYFFLTLEDKNRESTNTLRFIEERLKLVSAELGDVEQNVESYRRAKGITDLSEEANLFLGKVEQNDANLNEVDVNLKILEGVERYIAGNQVGNIAPATLGVSDPVMTNYINQLANLETERTKLAQTVQAGNPYLETLNTQMRNVKQAILENINNQKANLQVQRNNLQTINNRLKSTISTIPRKEREFVGIKRQASVKENLYLLLLQKREETALSYASTVTDSRIVEEPYASGGPVRPNSKKIYTYAFMIGLLVPFAFIFLKDLLRTTVHSRKEIENKTGLKIYGEISKLPNNKLDQVINLKSRSFVSEQIRMIRSNMQFLFAPESYDRGKTILITSSVAGEGKSFVTLNIGYSLAIMDKKVVILGLDLRKPKINEYLGIENGVGLSNYLINQAKGSEIIQCTSIDNLYFIPSGPIPPNPAELLTTERLGALVDSLRHEFDYILFDTPPVGLVTDATLMAHLADISFYVVRHEMTPKQHLITLADVKEKKLFKSLNVIFNSVNYENSSEYNYGYGNNSYYGSESTRKRRLKKVTSLFK